MSVKSGQAVTVLFSTANATTGAATDATGTPTGTLYVNGTANGATVTVTNLVTGVYKAAVTLPSLSAGDVVSLRAAATVSAVAGEGIIWQDVADTKRVSDLNDASNTTLESRLTATRAGYLDNLSAGAVALQGSVDDLEGRLTAARAGYLDKLNVSGTLAHSDAAATYKADVSALALEATAQSILTDTAEIGAAGAGLTAADDAVIAAIAALNNLSSAGAQAAAAAALTAYGAATAAALDDVPTNAELTTALADLPTNAELSAAIAAGDDAVLAAVGGLSTFDPTTDAVIVGSIQTDAVSAAAIAAAAANEIADAVLLRSYSHVEDTAGDHSLAALIAGALESAIAGTTWTIYKTDGVTTMLTKTVATDGAAEPITGVA